MDKQEKHLKKQVKRVLADHLGVEIEDIDVDDNFKDDLHMGAVQLTDFGQKLSDAGIEVENLDFNEIENLSDLFEALL